MTRLFRWPIWASVMLAVGALTALTVNLPWSGAWSKDDAISTDIAIGAIRWDYWYKESPENRVLSNPAAQAPVPFFARRLADGKVESMGDIEPVLAAETAYARAIGVDYFLFGFYPDTGSWGRTPAFSLGINRALSAYLRLPDRKGVKFAIIINQFYPEADVADVAASIAELVADPDYQLTHHGAAPIFILGHDGLDLSNFFGTPQKARAAMDAIRTRVKARTGRDSLFSLMHWDTKQVREAMERYGLDMMSAYVQAPPARGKPTAFVDCQAFSQRAWLRAEQDKIPVAPNVTLGWDPRPRTTSERADGKILPDAAWCAHASRTEWSEAFRAAGQAVAEQGSGVPFRSVVVYAWNEFTEGGWMAPTWSEGAQRMNDLRAAIGRDRKMPPVELRFPANVDNAACPLRTAARPLDAVTQGCSTAPARQFMEWPCPAGMRAGQDSVSAPTGLERLVWPGGWVNRKCRAD